MDKWIHNVVVNNIRKGNIAEKEAEIYEYGYTLMFEKMIIFVVCVFIALILDAVWEVLALCITFIPLRVYSGGYHAKSRWGCMVISGLFLIIGVLGARFIGNFINLESFIVVEIVCILVLSRYAPADIEEKRITESEKSYFRRRVMIVVGSELLLGILFFFFQKYPYAVIIMVSNFLGTCSVIGGLRQKGSLIKL